MSQTCLGMVVLVHFPCIYVQTTSFTFSHFLCKYCTHGSKHNGGKVFHFTAAIENFLRSLRGSTFEGLSFFIKLQVNHASQCFIRGITLPFFSLHIISSKTS